MNVGSKEGTISEIWYTKTINKNKTKYCQIIGIDPNYSYAVHLTKKRYGFINKQKISPKSDIIFCSGNISENGLKDLDYYINENMINKLNLEPIQGTGISAKLSNSKNFTYTKMSSSTFIDVFKNPYLGCGASIYCRKQDEVYKNKDILTHWDLSEDKFINYFQRFMNTSQIQIGSISDMSEIKSYCNEKIKEMILNEDEIYNFIFRGIGNFDDPYFSTYFIQNNKLILFNTSNNKFKDFIVTTGSGRSKGIYTIIIKPSN